MASFNYGKVFSEGRSVGDFGDSIDMGMKLGLNDLAKKYNLDNRGLSSAKTENEKLNMIKKTNLFIFFLQKGAHNNSSLQHKSNALLFASSIHFFCFLRTDKLSHQTSGQN